MQMMSAVAAAAKHQQQQQQQQHDHHGTSSNRNTPYSAVLMLECGKNTVALVAQRPLQGLDWSLQGRLFRFFGSPFLQQL